MKTILGFLVLFVGLSLSYYAISSVSMTLDRMENFPYSFPANHRAHHFLNGLASLMIIGAAAFGVFILSAFVGNLLF